MQKLAMPTFFVVTGLSKIAPWLYCNSPWIRSSKKWLNVKRKLCTDDPHREPELLCLLAPTDASLSILFMFSTQQSVNNLISCLHVESPALLLPNLPACTLNPSISQRKAQQAALQIPPPSSILHQSCSSAAERVTSPQVRVSGLKLLGE